MNKLVVALCALVALAGVGGAKESDDQAKITKILSDIVDAAQKKELDKLDAFHAYGPKFSKFEDDGVGRQDAATAQKGERDGLGGVKSFVAHVSDWPAKIVRRWCSSSRAARGKLCTSISHQ